MTDAVTIKLLEELVGCGGALPHDLPFFRGMVGQKLNSKQMQFLRARIKRYGYLAPSLLPKATLHPPKPIKLSKRRKKLRATFTDGYFHCHPPFDAPVRRRLECFHSVTERGGVWTVPACMPNAETLTRIGFEGLGGWAEENEGWDDFEYDTPLPLRPFQTIGANYIEGRGRVLIADEMGLGKTIQALAWIGSVEESPVVVVCPAHLKRNWKKETKRWVPDAVVCVLSGRKNLPKKLTIPKHKQVIIIVNYDILDAWKPQLRTIDVAVVVVDECQMMKNDKAKRTRALKLIAAHCPYIIALSGTPLESRPIELRSVLGLLRPDIPTFNSKQAFGRRYCGARQERGHWKYDGATRQIELHDILIDQLMLRRKKADVLKELPEKTRRVVVLDMEASARVEYEKAESNFLGWMRDNAMGGSEKAIALQKMGALLQLAAKGKLGAAIEWIEMFLETGKKLLVFTTHTAPLQMICKHFGPRKCVSIYGQTSKPKRAEAEERFQTDDKTRLMVGNLTACSTGLTLTAASDVVMLEFDWRPAIHWQGEDRVHRIGQRDGCVAWYLVADRTIDIKMARVIDSKGEVLSTVLDGTKSRGEGEDLLSELITEYKQGE